MSATKHAQQLKQDSQDYLTTALFQLLETHDLHDIKITALVKRAGVSRMAFYRNYESLEALLRAYFEPKVAALFNDVILQASHEKKAANMVAFFEEFEHTLTLAVNRHFEDIIRQIFNDNMARYYPQTAVWQQLTPTQQTYWVAFMSDGVYAIWRQWFLDGRQAPIETIHGLVGAFQRATAVALTAGGPSVLELKN